ncbi:MAG TPA: hypothetical protein VGI45_28385 [Terracidiphilus sp.]|jgi:hypothetical protein
MKSTIVIQAATCLTAAAAFGVSALSQPATPQLLRTQTAFELTVRLPYAQAAALFGPEGERAWAGKHWNPQFLYPQAPHDEQNAVFTIQHGPVTAVWVNTLFDLETRHFIYACFLPGIMVSTIDVRFALTDTNTTQVHVVYTRTALAPVGNNHVTAFTEMDKTAAHDWQQAIDTHLASSKHEIRTVRRSRTR